MSGRVTGYHYEYRSDGTKYRVYDENTRAPRKKGSRQAPAAASRSNTRRSYIPRAPRPKAIRGQGAYYDSSFVRAMKKAIPKGSFADAGAMVAGPLGKWAGGALAKIAGFGEYRVSSNSLIGEGESPAMMHSSNDVTVVRHREYIMDIVSSGVANAFVNETLNIQPGLETSFPWLAPIAQQFEQYTIKGMVFEYKTLYADAIASSAANSSIGGVIMATDYNVLNAAFTTKQQMDNTQYTTSCKPSVSFYHPIECKPISVPTNQLFVRSGAPPTSGDLRLYDLGLFQIASFGVASTNVVLGELWCTYEIEFSKPINNGVTANVLSDHFRLGTVTNATPLGTTSVSQSGSSLGGTISSGVAYNFPPNMQEGNYLFVLSWVGSSTAALQVPTVSGANCQLLTMWNNDSSTASNTSPATTSGNMWLAFIIQLADNASAGNNAQVVLGTAGTLPASVTGADLFVTEIDSDILT